MTTWHKEQRADQSARRTGVQPVVHGAHEEIGSLYLISKGDDYYHHPNPQGTALFAGRMLRALEQRGLVRSCIGGWTRT